MKPKENEAKKGEMSSKQGLFAMGKAMYRVKRHDGMAGNADYHRPATTPPCRL
jgi:hypothetical protein